jgi:hypothetical protein
LTVTVHVLAPASGVADWDLLAEAVVVDDPFAEAVVVDELEGELVLDLSAEQPDRTVATTAAPAAATRISRLITFSP